MGEVERRRKACLHCHLQKLCTHSTDFHRGMCPLCFDAFTCEHFPNFSPSHCGVCFIDTKFCGHIDYSRGLYKVSYPDKEFITGVRAKLAQHCSDCAKVSRLANEFRKGLPTSDQDKALVQATYRQRRDAAKVLFANQEKYLADMAADFRMREMTAPPLVLLPALPLDTAIDGSSLDLNANPALVARLPVPTMGKATKRARRSEPVR